MRAKRILGMMGTLLFITVIFSAVSALAAQNPSYALYCAKATQNASRPTILLSLTDAQIIGGTLTDDGKIMLPADGEISFDVALEQLGAYRLELTYRSIEGERNDIEYGVMIDGAYPFAEAERMKLFRLWKSASAITQTNQGDDIVPEQVLADEAVTACAQDSDGLYAEPFLFCFDFGAHTLSLEFSRGGLLLESARLLQADQTLSYDEYRMAGQNLVSVCENQCIRVEAENTYRTSSPALAPIYDKSSAATLPSSPVFLRLNTVGSYNWEDAGQWISWEVNIPESGWYHLAFRYRQNLSEGFFSSRKLLIDGAMPFAEASDIRFEYGNDWQTLSLGTADVPYGVYLTEGTHVLRLEVTTGAMAEHIQALTETVTSLNALYRRIIMITGTSPDIFQDYNLKESVPDMVGDLRSAAEMLRTLADRIESLSSGGNAEASYLRSVAYQFEDIVNHPETMKERLDTFKSNLSALAAWMLELKDQPLELDAIYVMSMDVQAPDTLLSFGEEMKYAFSSFLSSFVRDYSNLGNVYEGGEARTLRVWMTGGRDQAQVAKNLIDNRFVARSGIQVNLELVQGGLTEAILSGDAPDVIITLGHGDPVNLGVRGALLDLSQFNDYQDVAGRFTQEANSPYTYQEKAYGLPVTQSFCMMFYRTDVFAELGLEVPETWDAFLKTARILQRNNLQVGVPVPSGTVLNGYDLFSAFLYQHGGSLLNEDQTRAVLDSPEAIEAFTEWTTLFVDIGLPLSYDFYSRFRTGEMPLAIQYYTQYNLLMTSAPDLTGLWKMVQLPGTLRDDGTIDRSVMASGTACGISASAEYPDAAWAFIKWWTEAETQYQYGTQLETLMGAAVRYDTANLEALKLLPWSKEEYENLYAQITQIRELPEIPASYFIYRSLSNAFRKVVYNTTVNPRETIIDYNLQINKELKRKLAEFAK